MAERHVQDLIKELDREFKLREAFKNAPERQAAEARKQEYLRQREGVQHPIKVMRQQNRPRTA